MLIMGTMLAVILTAGCRAAADQNSIESIDPMDEPLTFVLSTEVQEEMQPMISELLGGEEEQEKELLADADIYNQPSMQASQLGAVKEGDILSVLGICEDKDWYKVVYNGRVAYVRTEAVAAEEGTSEEINSLGQRIQNQEPSVNRGMATGTRRPVTPSPATEQSSASNASSVTEEMPATDTEPDGEGISSTENPSTTEGNPTTEESSTASEPPTTENPPEAEPTEQETGWEDTREIME